MLQAELVRLQQGLAHAPFALKERARPIKDSTTRAGGSTKGEGDER
jgi:hypothetical protein